MKTFVCVFLFVLMIPGLLLAQDPCPAQSSVTVTSRNGAYPKDLQWGIQKTLALQSKNVGWTEFTIHLANFDLQAKSFLELSKLKLNPGQAMIRFGLVREEKGTKDVKIVPGVYDFTKAQGQGPQVGNAQIKVANGTSVSYNYHKTTGTFTITKLTGKEVCGTFDLKDDFNHVAGRFKAPIL